jgi:hypothetical protein
MYFSVIHKHQPDVIIYVLPSHSKLQTEVVMSMLLSLLLLWVVVVVVIVAVLVVVVVVVVVIVVVGAPTLVTSCLASNYSGLSAILTD